jgi:hypothetical protein
MAGQITPELINKWIAQCGDLSDDFKTFGSYTLTAPIAIPNRGPGFIRIVVKPDGTITYNLI